MRYLLAIVLATLGLASQGLHAQNLKQDLQNIMQELFTKPHVNIDAELKVYGADPSHLAYAMKIDLNKSGSDYVLKLGPTEVIYNERYVITIEDESKTIYVTPRSNQEIPEDTDELLLGLDSIVAKEPEYTYHQEGGFHKYIMANHFAEYRSVEVWLDKEKTSLKKIIFLYNEEIVSEYSKVEVEYNSFNTKAVKKSIFSEKRVIQKQGDKYVLAAPYQSYNLELLDY